ncbi:MAG: hypothetical protein ACLTS6_13075 [Anaerobutyricum sp.]
MTHILQELSFYLSYPFVRYAALIASGVLIALKCSFITWGNISAAETFFFLSEMVFLIALPLQWRVATISKLVNNTILPLSQLL